MRAAALFALAGAVLVHAWVSWLSHRYSFAMLDGSSLVRMNTATGDFAVCSVRAAFLTSDRTIVCAVEYPADE
ncbi:MAG: hypothetical protein AAF865_14660 [Pseudomonadota bacterium]